MIHDDQQCFTFSKVTGHELTVQQCIMWSSNPRVPCGAASKHTVNRAKPSLLLNGRIYLFIYLLWKSYTKYNCWRIY